MALWTYRKDIIALVREERSTLEMDLLVVNDSRIGEESNTSDYDNFSVKPSSS